MSLPRAVLWLCAGLVLLSGATSALAKKQQQQDETFTIHYDAGSRDQVNNKMNFFLAARFLKLCVAISVASHQGATSYRLLHMWQSAKAQSPFTDELRKLLLHCLTAQLLHI
jgi:hypothetical protein